MEVVIIEAADSPIDEVIKVARDSKTEVNESIMGPLMRLDQELPQVPKIIKQPT